MDNSDVKLVGLELLGVKYLIVIRILIFCLILIIFLFCNG